MNPWDVPRILAARRDRLRRLEVRWAARLVAAPPDPAQRGALAREIAQARAEERIILDEEWAGLQEYLAARQLPREP